MILASRHSWARLVAAIAFTIACMNVHVDAKQAPKKKQKTTAVKSSAKKSKPAAKTTAKPADKAPPKEAQPDSSVVKIDANDPKAFTKAILLDKQGVEFEVVGEEKQPAPKLVVKEKKNEDFFDFSTMLVPITHPAPIASKYGIRDHRLHRGVDVSVIKDEPVLAAFPGVVTMAKYNKGGYGHYVIVDHENGLQTLYGHLSERLVKIGNACTRAISWG